MDPSSQPPAPAPLPPSSPADSSRQRLWLLAGGAGLIILLGIIFVFALRPSSSTLPQSGGGKQREASLKVGSQSYVYPCQLLREDVITTAFAFKDVRTHTIGETAALPIASIGKAERDLAPVNRAKALEASCQLILGFGDDATNTKTFILDVDQYADPQAAQKQFALERQRAEGGDGFRAVEKLGEKGYLVLPSESVRHYFAYAQVNNLILKLSHDPEDNQNDLSSNLKTALGKLVQAAKGDTTTTPKNTSGIVSIDQTPFADVCPTLNYTAVSKALGGVRYDLTKAEATSFYTTPIEQSQSAPYAVCTVHFTRQNGAAKFPHTFKLTTFLLPSAQFAQERLAGIQSKISENARSNTNLSGIASVPGLGDGAFKVHNGYNALNKRFEVDEYRVALGHYLVEISTTQIDAGNEAVTITPEVIKQILPAIQKAIDAAKQ